MPDLVLLLVLGWAAVALVLLAYGLVRHAATW